MQVDQTEQPTVPEVKSVYTRDQDAIEIIHTFMVRKKLGTYSEALEKLLQRAKEAGLHLHDHIPLPTYPVVGTIGGNSVVDPPKPPRRR